MSLFRAIVKSCVKNLGNVAGALVGVPVAGDIVVGAWNDWQEQCDRKQMRQELEAFARKTVQEAVAEAREAVHQEAANLAEKDQEHLVKYLSLVPSSIRRSLRRPEDHTGTTLPSSLVLEKAGDLLSFLPAKLPRFQAGTSLVHSDLELVELIGQGGFGEVWKARHLDRPKQPPVALKFCLDADAARSLQRERDLLDHIAGSGRSEGIVQLLYTHFRADPPFLEYEFIEGGDLTSIFADLHAGIATDPDSSARTLLDLARIVGHAHGQDPPIIHRDLKPANILVRQVQGRLQFKIADFGIGGLAASKALHEFQTGRTKPSQQHMETVRGAYTPLYASPEQVRGEPPDPRDDVHALGIIWYQLQTGNLSLLALPSHWREDLQDTGMKEPFIQLLALCIARLKDRPKDAGDLAQRLEKLFERAEKSVAPNLSSAPPPISPPIPPQQSKRSDWRNFDFTGYDLNVIGAAYAAGKDLKTLGIPPGTAALFSEKLNQMGFWKGKKRQGRSFDGELAKLDLATLANRYFAGENWGDLAREVGLPWQALACGIVRYLGFPNHPVCSQILRLLAEQGSYSKSTATQRQWLDQQLVGKVEGVISDRVVNEGLISLRDSRKIAFGRGSGGIREVWLTG